MPLEPYAGDFNAVGVIMTAFGFMRLLDGVPSGVISIATVLITVIGLLLMLLL